MATRAQSLDKSSIDARRAESQFGPSGDLAGSISDLHVVDPTKTCNGDTGGSANIRSGLLAQRNDMQMQRAANDEKPDLVNVRKRQARSVETRKKILEAATVEFASVGFDGATSRSIANNAGVPHALLIYHFETKLGVWEAVMEKAIADFHDELAIVSEQHRNSDAVTALRALQRLFIEMAASRPELNWLMSHEVGGDLGRLNWLMEKRAGRDIDVAVGLIREAQRQGRFIEGDPAHLHFLFVGTASRVFLMQAEIERTMGRSPFDAAFLEQHIALCQSLFFRDPPGDDDGKSE